MAEKLASLRKKGGGKMSETALWTNSSPTSAFAGGNVSLSDSIENYKYIKVVWKYNTTVTDTEVSVFLVEEINDTVFRASLCFFDDIGSKFYNRVMIKNTSTSLIIGEAVQYFYNSAGVAANMACIPLEILGVK